MREKKIKAKIESKSCSVWPTPFLWRSTEISWG